MQTVETNLCVFFLLSEPGLATPVLMVLVFLFISPLGAIKEQILYFWLIVTPDFLAELLVI